MNNDYTKFITAAGFTNLADGIAMVVWAWVASLLTRDPVMIATVAMALRLPWFLCTIPAGLVTDRVDRRRLILAMDALRAAGFLAVGLAVSAAYPFEAIPATGTAHPFVLAALIVAALVVGTAEVFRDNAAQTLLPAIVPSEALEKMNGRLWALENVAQQLAGPAIGAFLVGLAAPIPFFGNAAIYLFAIYLMSRIVGNFRPQRQDTANLRAEFLEAFTYLRNALLIRSLAIITGAWNLTYQMMLIGLILHVQDNLGLGAQAYGFILAGSAIGGVIGGLWGDRVVAGLGPWRAAKLMIGTAPFTFAAIAVAPGGISLALVLAFSQFTAVIWNTVAVSYRQRQIPDVLLGRVNSLYRLLAWGVMPIGLLASGIIVRLTDGPLNHSLALKMPFYAAALGGVIMALWGIRAIALYAPKNPATSGASNP